MRAEMRAAEEAARNSYGKLLSILSTRTGDIASAEDALADAFAKALKTWPDTGVPDRPEAWLLTAARNAMTDHHRRMSRMDVTDEVPEIETMEDIQEFPDERLKLMFVCAHPAIDPAIHTPLMLQTVLGLEASQVAAAYATSASGMAQRLVRAKRKIKASGIPFVIPDQANLKERRKAVLDAIYGVYSIDWLHGSDDLGAEALYLANLMTQLMPKDAEVLGLAALIAFSLSRQSARYINGAFVPLEDQDPNLWDQTLIDRAALWLDQAQSLGEIGPYQLEAAISSVHAHRKVTGETNWTAISQLYTGLVHYAPTLGAMVAQAAALGHAQGPEVGLAALCQLHADNVKDFQPYHATRAHFLTDTDPQAAAEAYQTAIDLTSDPDIQKFLLSRKAQLALI